ncbi:putative DNA binding domain-containing protein [Streptomyces sp. NBC_01218]|uniref:RNA-binding domain-containing protein n=1 Tax=Streptomyces sp. NBC_01218 TaxID=2903780 RepID=UPI002E0E1014|nr:putative DNA binding domain-containing protein [Streptomyces sp. NBC_01218]
MEGRTITKGEAESILNRQESHFWDFKSATSGGATIQKIASALANAEGGEFIVGIEDPKTGKGITRWQGFGSIEDANWIQQSLVDHVQPPIPYDIEYLRVKGYEQAGWACLVTVQKSPDVHKTAKGEIHQRRGGENARLNGAQITDLSLSKGARSYEDQLLEDYDLEELQEEEELHYFLKSYSPTMSAEKFVKRQRLIDRKTLMASVAGAILFAEEPPTVVPKRCSVKIARYETSEKEPDRKYLKSSPESIDGPARVLIDRTLSAVTQLIQSVPVLSADGTMSPMNYPPEALKEIIVNAVIHRDYNISDDILISVFDNRVEVRSPGRLPGHMTQENLFTDRFARNPSIVRLLNKYPDAPNKDIGEGLDTVLSTMKAAKLKAPQFTVHENAFVVILEHTPLARPEELVLQYLASNEEIVNRIARQLTGIESENAMKRVFYKLRDAGKIEPVPNRSRARAAWQIKKP